MQEAGNPLARVLARVVTAQEREGTRIARLLHDEVGQILSAVGLHLDLLRMDIEKESPATAKRIIESQKILEQAVDQVRALSYELDPEVVRRAGLEAAMDRLVGRYRETAGRPVRLLFDSSLRVPTPAATAMYKIAEAAIDNAIKHGECRLIEVFVQQHKAGIELRVRDDGNGFDPRAAFAHPAGLGLLLMQCHADQGGLKLEIQSRPERGTIVKAGYRGKPRQ